MATKLNIRNFTPEDGDFEFLQCLVKALDDLGEYLVDEEFSKMEIIRIKKEGFFFDKESDSAVITVENEKGEIRTKITVRSKVSWEIKPYYDTTVVWEEEGMTTQEVMFDSEESYDDQLHIYLHRIRMDHLRAWDDRVYL